MNLTKTLLLTRYSPIKALLVSKKLISTANKYFRSASNTFKNADFVYIREQEILPHLQLAMKKYNTINNSIIAGIPRTG